ncbi:hypothetical protein JCM3770_003664 [Rhodotorula araucariae]
MSKRRHALSAASSASDFSMPTPDKRLKYGVHARLLTDDDDANLDDPPNSNQRSAPTLTIPARYNKHNARLVDCLHIKEVPINESSVQQLGNHVCAAREPDQNALTELNFSSGELQAKNVIQCFALCQSHPPPLVPPQVVK